MKCSKSRMTWMWLLVLQIWLHLNTTQCLTTKLQNIYDEFPEYTINFIRDLYFTSENDFKTAYLHLDSDGGPEKECIVLRTANSSKVDVVCSREWPYDVMFDILQAWWLHASDIKEVQLNCGWMPIVESEMTVKAVQSDAYMTSPTYVHVKKECVCMEIYLLVENDTLHEFIIRDIHPCYNNTVISHSHLQGLSSLQSLSIHTSPYLALMSDTFMDLQMLQMLSLSFPPGSPDLPHGLLCPIPQIEAIFLKSISCIESPFHLFDCTLNTNDTSHLINLTLLILTDSDISALSSWSFQRTPFLKELNLSHNKLNYIDSPFNNLTKLQFLSLAYNRLSYIEPFTFYNLSSLHCLDLSHNELTVLSINLFSKLTKLYALFINDNNISQIVGSFNIFHFLQFISLSHNNLVIVQREWFQFTWNLIILHLENNAIQKFEDTSLSGLHHLKFLNISFNHIDDIKNFTNGYGNGSLISLDMLLMSNNKLEDLPNYAFAGLYTLRYLVLNENYISNMADSSLDKLYFLRVIFLESNQLSYILPYTFLTMQNTLTHINLFNNSIKDVDPNLFTCPIVNSIDLSFNNITLIVTAAFGQCLLLSNLNLENNKITEIQAYAFNSNLRFLEIGSNHLSSFCPQPLNDLISLNISHNAFTHLNSTILCPLPSLLVIDLGANGMLHIDEGVFLQFELLWIIILSRNRLDLDFSIDIFKGPRRLESLSLVANSIHDAKNLFLHPTLRVTDAIYLDANPLQTFSEQPQHADFPLPIPIETTKLSLTVTNITWISPAAFQYMSRLNRLYLRVTNITSFSEFNFVSNEVLSNLNVEMYNSPVECSCTMKWLRQNEDLWEIYKIEHCYDSITHDVVKFYEHPIDRFVCKTENLCDIAHCTCFTETQYGGPPSILLCNHRNLTIPPYPLAHTARIIHLQYNKLSSLIFNTQTMDTETLYLHNSHISSISSNTFSKFINLKHLFMHQNKLTNLPDGLFHMLYKLSSVTLHNNQLLEISSLAFMNQYLLTSVTLDNNNIKLLNDGVRSQLSSLSYLFNLTLHDNPWQCDCDNLTWKTWLFQMSHIISNIVDIRCTNGTTVVHTLDVLFLCPNISNITDIIQEKYKMTVQTIAVLASFIGTAIILTIIIFYFRFMIAVLLFNKTGVRIRASKEKKTSFNLFFSYNRNEENVLRNVVLPITHVLEKVHPKYDCFIPERDILGGTFWNEEIYNGIHDSNCTMIILTPMSVRNSEVMYMFDIAYDLVSLEKWHQIIIFISDPNILKLKDLDPRLKYMLQRGKYLLKEEKYFWQKLAYYLPGCLRKDYKATIVKAEIEEALNTSECNYTK